MNFFKKTIFFLVILFGPSSYVAAHNHHNVGPDHNLNKNWQTVKAMMFGSKYIEQNSGVIQVYLNTKADDASTVPVMINGLIDQDDNQFIKKLFLIVDENPSPVAAVINFTPESGRVKLETRLRFEKFSFVRAVAELNNGTLHMSQKYVHAAGGCSSPAGDRAEKSLIGKMKFRFHDKIKFNEPNLVQMQIKHPNESSLATDFDQTKVPQFVRNLDVTYNGTSVISANLDFSISDNPIFRFYFKPTEKGELNINVKDTHDNNFTKKIKIDSELEPKIL